MNKSDIECHPVDINIKAMVPPNLSQKIEIETALTRPIIAHGMFW